MMEPKATRYEPIVVSSESTVVAEFVPDAASATSYQSEADLERQLVKLLADAQLEFILAVHAAFLRGRAALRHAVSSATSTGRFAVRTCPANTPLGATFWLPSAT